MERMVSKDYIKGYRRKGKNPIIGDYNLDVDIKAIEAVLKKILRKNEKNEIKY